MNKFTSLIAAALSLMVTPALAQQTITQPKMTVHTQCHAPGITLRGSCVVGYKVLNFSHPTWWAELKRSSAAPLKNKGNEYSIVQYYRLPTTTPRSTCVGFSAIDTGTQPGEGMISEDLCGQQVFGVYITTHNNGRTWTPIKYTIL